MKKRFALAAQILFSHKRVLLYSLMPLVLGLALYVTLGLGLVLTLAPIGKNFIFSIFPMEALGIHLLFVLGILLTIFFLLFTNWVLLLFITFLSSPFNDAISRLVEERVLNVNVREGTLREILLNSPQTFKRELKKILFFITFSLLGMLFSLFVITFPIMILFSAIMVSVSYLDYSWSRAELGLSEIIREYKTQFISYGFNGLLFMIFMGIPVLGFFFLPFATIYFTLLRIEKIKDIYVSDQNRHSSTIRWE